ncbi:hypothetical protein GCM10020366_71350 [Saccharopolyspora gregorii]|uniref:thiosulfate sulfurtransferase n=1 Tax=Saccharopolyspora gregorii TaxID=33914 RepID=A0ABP6S336_9PSEU
MRRDFVSREGFEKLLSAKGISNDDTVILYGGNNNWFAAYAYWYFKLYGHSDVKLLDGGRKKWELDGRQLVKDEAEPRRHQLPGAGPRHLDPRVPRRGRRRDRHQEPGGRALPDEFGASWSPPRTCRRSRRSARAHPAGGDVPWSKTANEDGTFKSDDDLKNKIYAEAGWTTRRTPSPTAASASAPRTAGSCSASFWGTRT